MHSKIKTTLLTGFLFLLLISGVQAQDKYDFASVAFIPHMKEITVSFSAQETQRIKVEKEEFIDNLDTKPILKHITKMQSDGWEIFNNETLFIPQPTYWYYLRKKQP